VKRQIVNGLTIVSLALALATATLWLHSYFRNDYIIHVVNRGPAGGSTQTLFQSLRGRLWIVWSITGPNAWLPNAGTSLNSMAPIGVGWNWPWLWAHDNEVLICAGFTWYRDPQAEHPRDRYALGIPHYFPLAIFLLLPLRQFFKARRHPPGHCPHCGYDLRATPDRCPECGTDVKSGSSR